MIFFSCENVGKTSFKTRLMGSSNEKDNKEAYYKVQHPKKEEEMTHGVDIFKYRNPKNDTIISIWDFAGITILSII